MNDTHTQNTHQMNNYTVDYQDYEGDEYSETFDTIEEARECIKNVKENDGMVTSKWTHDADGHLVRRGF